VNDELMVMMIVAWPLNCIIGWTHCAAYDNFVRPHYTIFWQLCYSTSSVLMVFGFDFNPIKILKLYVMVLFCFFSPRQGVHLLTSLFALICSTFYHQSCILSRGIQHPEDGTRNYYFLIQEPFSFIGQGRRTKSFLLVRFRLQRTKTEEIDLA
jgi:hypothetical protein